MFLIGFPDNQENIVRYALFLMAGYAPAGQLLFLACPSKSNQKERHPAYRPQQRTLGVPCVARHAGRLRNSRYALRQSSPTSPGMAALLGGAQGPQKFNPVARPRSAILSSIRKIPLRAPCVLHVENKEMK